MCVCVCVCVIFQKNWGAIALALSANVAPPLIISVILVLIK